LAGKRLQRRSQVKSSASRLVELNTRSKSHIKESSRMNVGVISVVESVSCLIHFVYKVKHAAKERILFAKVLKNTTKLLRDVRANFDSHLVCILPEERTFIKGVLDQAEVILRTIRHVIHIKDDADDEKNRQPLMTLIKWLLVNRDVAGVQMGVLSQQSIALLLINFKLELDKKLQSYADRAGWSSPPQYSAMPEDVPRYLDEYHSDLFPLTARFEKDAIMEIPSNSQLVSNTSIWNTQNDNSVYRWLFTSVMRTAGDVPLRLASIEV
ncbi:hypothetical protein Egran_00595, partial [Elaphomyces granulatus]